MDVVVSVCESVCVCLCLSVSPSVCVREWVISVCGRCGKCVCVVGVLVTFSFLCGVCGSGCQRVCVCVCVCVRVVCVRVWCVCVCVCVYVLCVYGTWCGWFVGWLMCACGA